MQKQNSDKDDQIKYELTIEKCLSLNSLNIPEEQKVASADHSKGDELLLGVSEDGSEIARSESDSEDESIEKADARVQNKPASAVD